MASRMAPHPCIEHVPQRWADGGGAHAFTPVLINHDGLCKPVDQMAGQRTNAVVVVHAAISAIYGLSLGRARVSTTNARGPGGSKAIVVTQPLPTGGILTHADPLPGPSGNFE